jgi:hypothetical protein
MSIMADDLKPEERDYLEQRRQDVRKELKDFAAGKHRPMYVDPAERMQELTDELEQIEYELRRAKGVGGQPESEEEEPADDE